MRNPFAVLGRIAREWNHRYDAQRSSDPLVRLQARTQPIKLIGGMACPECRSLLQLCDCIAGDVRASGILCRNVLK